LYLLSSTWTAKFNQIFPWQCNMLNVWVLPLGADFILGKPIFFEAKAVVMGPGQNFLTLVRSGQIFISRVGSAIFSLGLAFENFPLKSYIFQFLPFGPKKISSGWVKAGSASYLLWVKSMLGSGPISTKLGPERLVIEIVLMKCIWKLLVLMIIRPYSFLNSKESWVATHHNGNSIVW